MDEFDRDGTVLQTNKGAIAGARIRVKDHFNQSRKPAKSELPMNNF